MDAIWITICQQQRGEPLRFVSTASSPKAPAYCLGSRVAVSLRSCVAPVRSGHMRASGRYFIIKVINYFRNLIKHIVQL